MRNNLGLSRRPGHLRPKAWAATQSCLDCFALFDGVIIDGRLAADVIAEIFQELLDSSEMFLW
jgi:hypothetical protein